MSPVQVERWSLVVDDVGTLHWGGPEEPRKLPEEWVLRQLRDTDLDDPASIAALLEEHGAISWPYFDPVYVPVDRLPLLGHLPSGEEQATDWWEQHPNAGKLEDARWWLKTVRALAGVWAEACVGGDPGQAWAAEGFRALSDERACWSQFAVALNIGLQPFRAHIEHRVEFPSGEITYGLPRVGLYSAACHQVFNFVVKEETARRCENQTCRRTFIHQLGGAQHGQYRSTGLKYCSPECARAETQRQYRRRNAARRKEQQP